MKRVLITTTAVWMMAVSPTVLCAQNVMAKVQDKDQEKSQRVQSSREGVDATIRAEDVADLLTWATNSKTSLEDGLKKIAEIPTAQRREELQKLIESVVSSSGTKATELLMRVTLNRALTFNELLVKNSQNSSEQDSLGRRILKDGALVALQVFVDDSQFLNQAQNNMQNSNKKEISLDLPIASVGIQSADYFSKRAMAAPSHQASLEMLKLTMGLLFNDLNKSQQRRQFAAVLNHIAEFSKSITNVKPTTPEEFLSLNRKIKAMLDEQIAQALRVPLVVVNNNTGSVIVGTIGTNVLGMRFAAIPAGTFMMGSPSSESYHDSDESQHRVTLTHGFEMQTTTVTQAQWAEVMGSNPSYFQRAGDCDDRKEIQVQGAKVVVCPNNPVEEVSYNDVQTFIQKLNETKRDGYTYKLPTEAQWEYAARAGTTSAYSFGDNPSSLGDYAWYDANSGQKTHPVATKRANGFGLYDMQGNVWQWVQDLYGCYSPDTVDPVGASSGSDRVIRGGSWFSDARNLRSANRYGYDGSNRSYVVGFRLVRTH